MLSEKGGWKFRRGLGWGWGARWGKVGQSGSGRKRKCCWINSLVGRENSPRWGVEGGCKIFFTNPEPPFTGKTRNGKGWEMWRYNVNMDI